MTDHNRELPFILFADFDINNKEALDRLFPLLYEELRKIAHWHLQKEKTGHTLNTTGLLHEAYIKLVQQKRVQWQNRAHFLAISATIMRRILIDHAKLKRAAKRGNGAPPMALYELTKIYSEDRAEQYIALDEALQKLSELDNQKGKVLEYQFFGGLTVKETATVLNISEAKVKRERSFGIAWIRRKLKQAS